MRRPVEASKREMKVEGFRLNGATGTPVLAEGRFSASVTDLGVGNYRLTFNEPFGRTPIAVASPLTDDTIVQISVISNLLVEVQAQDLVGVAQEADLCLMVYGSDVADEQ